MGARMPQGKPQLTIDNGFNSSMLTNPLVVLGSEEQVTNTNDADLRGLGMA